LEGLAKEKTQMKNEIRFAITLAGAVLCALPNLAIAQPGSGNSQGDQPASIEGAWFETISTPQGVPLFTALQSFAAGGVTSTAATLGPTSGCGSWKLVDNETYVVSWYFFVLSSPSSSVRVNATLKVSNDGNSIKGTATSFNCDQNGDSCVVNPGLVNVAGKRVIAQGASN
jgi:hypothetical protein